MYFMELFLGRGKRSSQLVHKLGLTGNFLEIDFSLSRHFKKTGDCFIIRRDLFSEGRYGLCTLKKVRFFFFQVGPDSLEPLDRGDRFGLLNVQRERGFLELRGAFL